MSESSAETLMIAYSKAEFENGNGNKYSVIPKIIGKHKIEVCIIKRCSALAFQTCLAFN